MIRDGRRPTTQDKDVLSAAPVPGTGKVEAVIKYPVALLKQIEAEARRRDLTLSVVLRQAWAQQHDAVAKLPARELQRTVAPLKGRRQKQTLFYDQTHWKELRSVAAAVGVGVSVVISAAWVLDRDRQAALPAP